MKSGILNFLEPSGPLQACNRTALPLFTFNYSLWISVLFPWYIFHIVVYVWVEGVLVAVNETFVYIGTHLSNKLICSSAKARIPRFTGFIPAQRYNEVYLKHILQLILFYNVFINNLPIFISKSLMCVFPWWLLQQHHSRVVLFSFIACLCCHRFFLLHSRNLYHILLCNFCNCNSFL